MIKWDRYNQQYFRKGSVAIALKRLKDSQNIGPSFFQELIAHLHCESNCFVLRCYGITQDPVTKEYIMVTDYATKGDFRTYMRTEFRELSWENQISLLQSVAHAEVETILIALRCRSTEVIYHDERSDSMYTGGFRHINGEGMYNDCNIHSQAIYESRCFKVTQLLKEIENLSVDDGLEQEKNEIDSLLADLNFS
ncbi:17211_t:CDS:2 [Dentiscutata erythropus]|uniref:17211_t:CDS:1 n=1 Tax=Dentiscutata erythropus TaxID=1348616 RepID=A0A9N9HZR0_9GLOM|nr:17211_t:CDS:2 [Dentiscutata erythropus]